MPATEPRHEPIRRAAVQGRRRRIQAQEKKQRCWQRRSVSRVSAAREYRRTVRRRFGRLAALRVHRQSGQFPNSPDLLKRAFFGSGLPNECVTDTIYRIHLNPVEKPRLRKARWCEQVTKENRAGPYPQGTHRLQCPGSTSRLPARIGHQ